MESSPLPLRDTSQETKQAAWWLLMRSIPHIGAHRELGCLWCSKSAPYPDRSLRSDYGVHIKHTCEQCVHKIRGNNCPNIWQMTPSNLEAHVPPSFCDPCKTDNHGPVELRWLCRSQAATGRDKCQRSTRGQDNGRSPQRHACSSHLWHKLASI